MRRGAGGMGVRFGGAEEIRYRALFLELGNVAKRRQALLGERRRARSLRRVKFQGSTERFRILRRIGPRLCE